MRLEFREKSIKMELTGFKMRFFKSTSCIKILYTYKVTKTISSTVIFLSETAPLFSVSQTCLWCVPEDRISNQEQNNCI